MSRHPRLVATVLAIALSWSPTAAAAQSLPELTGTPEATATGFLRSVRAIRWDAAARLLDDATLARFHQVVALMVEADTTGALGDYLTGTRDAGFRALTHAEVFDRSIGVTIDGMPGLMHALFDRDDEVLGHVPEADGTAHVVYRTTARLSGAVSEVRVMQLTRSRDGWRVSWSDELEVLDAALRGVPRTRTPPPGSSR